ncbi:MAG: PEP/pyruvate-binding domain-containing protein, partial [Agriterribacter sp.]
MNSYIKRFSEIRIADTAIVGGKNASLGEMFTQLSLKGIQVPDGFATTCFAFEEFLTYNALHLPLHDLMAQLDTAAFANLAEIGGQARTLMMKGQIPPKIKEEIIGAYQQLTENTGSAVAVRSSATAEDLPNASFAGQHESYLNIKGEQQLLNAIQKCYASLYTDRAIKYRQDNRFAHEKVSLSVGVQKIVRSDAGSSGVIFTLEPESGFRNIIHLSGVWGLGENIVQGTVIPDEFFVFKSMLHLQKGAIIQRRLGEKAKTMIYSDTGDSTVVNTLTPDEKRRQFVLDDAEVIKLAEWSMTIENHYQKPMDI